MSINVVAKDKCDVAKAEKSGGRRHGSFVEDDGFRIVSAKHGKVFVRSDIDPVPREVVS